MAEREKVSAEAEVTTTELAAILGITARRVQQMAQDGTIIPVRRGYFQLGDAVQRYINFLSKPQVSEAEQKLETARKQSEAQLKLSKAQLAKMEVEELKGRLHRSEDVEAFTEDLIYMRELSNYRYDPEKYAERVNERRNWGNAGRDYDEE